MGFLTNTAKTSDTPLPFFSLDSLYRKASIQNYLTNGFPIRQMVGLRLTFVGIGLITLSALLSCLNYKYIKFPTTIGLLLTSPLMYHSRQVQGVRPYW